MATLKQLKDMTKSKQWRDAYFRWKFGGQVDDFAKAEGISRQALAEKLKLSEGTLRHAIHASKKLTESQARRLKGKPIRSLFLIEAARTKKEIKQALDGITANKLNPTEARRQLRKQQRKVSTPRFRGDPVEDLARRATDFAAAARELIRLQIAENSTPARRRKMLKALKDAKKAIVDAKKATTPH